MSTEEPESSAVYQSTQHQLPRRLAFSLASLQELQISQQCLIFSEDSVISCNELVFLCEIYYSGIVIHIAELLLVETPKQLVEVVPSSHFLHIRVQIH